MEGRSEGGERGEQGGRGRGREVGGGKEGEGGVKGHKVDKSQRKERKDNQKIRPKPRSGNMTEFCRKYEAKIQRIVVTN